MNPETKELYNKALDAKHLYILGVISRDEAREEISPYIEAFNKKTFLKNIANDPS